MNLLPNGIRTRDVGNKDKLNEVVYNVDRFKRMSKTARWGRFSCRAVFCPRLKCIDNHKTLSKYLSQHSSFLIKQKSAFLPALPYNFHNQIDIGYNFPICVRISNLVSVSLVSGDITLMPQSPARIHI